MPPLKGGVSPALAPVTEGFPRRGGPCAFPFLYVPPVGAIHESPADPRRCPTSGRPQGSPARLPSLPPLEGVLGVSPALAPVTEGFGAAIRIFRPLSFNTSLFTPPLRPGKKALAPRANMEYNALTPPRRVSRRGRQNRAESPKQQQIYPGVAQLVARVVWDHQAAGSNPVTRTSKAPEPPVVLRGFVLWQGSNEVRTCRRHVHETVCADVRQTGRRGRRPLRCPAPVGAIHESPADPRPTNGRGQAPPLRSRPTSPESLRTGALCLPWKGRCRRRLRR